jgi:uncharacterized protein YbjT (DUF2867 family)
MILVTGATGTNGVALIEALLNRAERVRALVRDPVKAAERFAPEVELSRGDLADPESIDAALEGVDKVFLLSAVDPRQVELEANVTDAARRAGVAHLVKFSVYNASPDSRVPLVRWHGESERHVERSGLPWTFLRPNMFMQELLRQAESIRAQGQFYLPLADARVSLVDVRDLADVAATVLTTPGHAGKAYTLTGPQSLSFNEVAATLSRAAGRPIAYVPVSMDAFRQTFVAAGAPRWLVDAIADLYASFLAGDNAPVADGVQRVTGRPPRSLEQFARDHTDALA